MSWEWGLDLRILYISSRGKKISYEADMGLKSPLGENNWVDPKAWSMQIRKLLPHPWNLPPFSFSFCELRHGSSYRRLWSRQLLHLPWHEIDVRNRWPVWTRTTLLVALELWKNARHRNTCLNSSRLSLQLIGAYISQAFGIQFAQEKARYLGVPRHHNSELMWTNRSARQMVFLFQKYSGPHVEHVTGSWQSRELRCSYILRHFKNVTSYLPVNRASAYLTKIPSCPLVECFFVQRYKRDVFQRACWYLRISNLSVWVTGWTMYLDNPSPHAVPGKAKSSNNIDAGAAV